MIVIATVLAFEQPRQLAHVLASVAAQTRRPDHVIVVNHGSTAVSLDAATPLASAIDVGANLGVGAGHNRAIDEARRADADVVWLLEHDTYPDPDALERLIDALRANPDCVAVPMATRNNYERKWLPKPDADAQGNHVTPVDRCTFNGILMSIATAARVGRLREDFFAGGEDIDFAETATARGIQLLQVTNAVVVHPNKGNDRRSALRFDHPERVRSTTRRAVMVAPHSGMIITAAKAVAELVRPGRGLTFTVARFKGIADARRATKARRVRE